MSTGSLVFNLFLNIFTDTEINIVDKNINHTAENKLQYLQCSISLLRISIISEKQYLNITGCIPQYTSQHKVKSPRTDLFI